MTLWEIRSTMSTALVWVLALAISVRAAPLSAQGATSALAAIQPMAKARVKDVTSQFLRAVPRFSKAKDPRFLKTKGKSLLLQQEFECTAHTDCIKGQEYCDNWNACWTCSTCEVIDDAIDGQCPECEEPEPECTVHSDCVEGEEYCDSWNVCWRCSTCEEIDDAIDGQCPECDEEAGEPIDYVCFIQNAGECIKGIFDGVLDAVFGASAATAATAALEGFCANCTGAADEILSAFDACDISVTEEEPVAMLALANLLDSSCADTDCAGALLWAFQDLEERQDAFCDNSDCGLEIVAPLLLQTFLGSEVDVDCAQGFFGLFCIADTNSGNYCMDELEAISGGEDGEDEFSIAPFCASTCPADLTRLFNELTRLECGLDLDFTPEDCDELDYEFQLLDYCTVNDDGGYCIELITKADGPESCDDEFGGGVVAPAPGVPSPGVPAPGVPAPIMEETSDTQVCSTECQQGINDYVDDIGCCAAWSLDISCTPDATRDFIEDGCGVAIGNACPRPVLPEETAGAAASAQVKAAIAVVAGIATLAVFAAVL